MNKLYVGLNKKIELPEDGFLFIDDQIPKGRKGRIFDPYKHSFNPLENIDHKKARQIADILYLIYPQGENTLTVRNGKRALLLSLLEAKRLDQIEGDEEVAGMLDDMLTSPVLQRVLCRTTNFTFDPRTVSFARLNRSELGDFDALVLGLLLTAHFQGQVVLPDFGFYGRDVHLELIRQNRLIAGVNFLAELPPRLQQSVLLVKEKIACGAIVEDAETLARYAGHIPHTNAFNDFVARAVDSS